ncbi:MAG: endopeptidase La [Patescibacteria group bacterium]|nr:endopeptidase La [Patescibacteria group bacterium]
MSFLLGAPQRSVFLISAVRDTVVFPGTENVLVFGRPKSVNAINQALKGEKKLVLLLQKNPEQENPKKEDLYQIGVLVSIEKVAYGEKGEINTLVKGLEKVKLVNFTREDDYFEGSFEIVKDNLKVDEEVEAMVKFLSSKIKEAINLGKSIDFVFLMNLLNINNPAIFANQMAVVLDIKPHERQKLLEESDINERLKKEVDYLSREVKILEIEQKLSSKTQKRFEQGIRENILREKMRMIEEELGEKEDQKEINEYEEKIKKAKMPTEVEKKAMKELKRLRQMSQFNPETSYIRTYLDWLIELPWSISSASKIDINKAEKILNEDHYGLKKVKERILEYLAVLELKKNRKDLKKTRQPTIICFVGPPGVGKTSLGRSIARALGRKFVKVSLGGIRDEAEIRGHRRTYVGALPGRIIQGIKQVGTKNPVFMLDEIDKIGRDYRGDPSAALLEALDPEQNHSFSDHYLEVPFDLSEVFFITTANILDTIPPALLDRLEVINFPGYTEDEKFHIAKSYLIRKQLEVNGLNEKELKITGKAIKNLIRRYTREAGVRELERQIGTIMRKVARGIVEKKYQRKIVTANNLTKFLGPYKYSSQMIEERDNVGIATGLAWTQAGGDILFIEVVVMPGKGGLTLTGHLGEVMKESCQAALSYIRSRYQQFNLPEKLFQKIDLHVHVPEGAVPKDGPSAGLAIVTAMVSALTKISTDRRVAMTGEITLRGRVLEIGGVKEKVIAAHRAGIKTVILPKDNKKDLEDIPSYVLEDLKFVYVTHVDQVLKVALKEAIVSRKSSVGDRSF